MGLFGGVQRRLVRAFMDWYGITEDLETREEVEQALTDFGEYLRDSGEE